MNTTIAIVFALIAIIIIVSLIWRLASHRIKIPCPSWLGWMVELDNPFSKIHKARHIIANSDIQNGMTVIDIGCGPGRVTILAAEKVGLTGKVVAMDLQAAMLAKVEAKAKERGIATISLLHAGVGEGMLGQNMFDRALMVSVLGEIPKQKAALQEVFNALKSGGILSVTEIIFDPHYQRLGKIVMLAQEVGFEKQEQFSDWASYTLLFRKPSQ
jgi:ubiquinone/menaquinone biosynthesis C-methylase UbiE